MAKINIEFDGKVFTIDESTLTLLASPLEQALVKQLAGTGAVIRFNGNDYNVDANKLASARNVLTDHLSTVAGTDSKVTVNGIEYGLNKTKLQGATDRMSETFGVIGNEVKEPSQGLKYSLSEDGQSYSVTGIGTCEDTDLVIPDTYEGLPVTSIGERAFYNRDSLTSVTIPNSVMSIGSSAFYDCDGLTSVTIGSGVTSIGNSAFRYCDCLTSVTIGNSVTSIGDYAFEYCSDLTSITIPDSVTSIGNRAFYSCISLTSVTIGDGVTSIGDEEFYKCSSLTSITIPNSVTSIGNYAFYECSNLTSVTIGNSVTSIGNAAFRDCSSLTSITIPDSVTSIGDDAFMYCGSLTSVMIGNSVTSIGHWAFRECYNLTSITIPNSVTSIGDDAFQTCRKLVEVINKSAIDIKKGDLDGDNLSQSADEHAFYALEVHGGNSKIINKDGYLFYSVDGTNYLVNYIGTDINLILPATCNGETYVIHDFAFMQSNALNLPGNIKSVTIPDSVTSIGQYAFWNCEITSIIIPDSVTHIGGNAFQYCRNLEFITLGSNIANIGSYAFYETNYYNNESSWEDGVLYIGKYLIKARDDISGAYTIKEGTELIADSAFEPCYGLTSITIPDSVTSIGDYAFSSTGLTSVTIGRSVTDINPEKTFNYCSELKTIVINQYKDESPLKPNDWLVGYRYEYNESTDEDIKIPIYVPEQVTVIWKERA